MSSSYCHAGKGYRMFVYDYLAVKEHWIRLQTDVFKFNRRILRRRQKAIGCDTNGNECVLVHRFSSHRKKPTNRLDECQEGSVERQVGCLNRRNKGAPELEFRTLLICILICHSPAEKTFGGSEPSRSCEEYKHLLSIQDASVQVQTALMVLQK